MRGFKGIAEGSLLVDIAGEVLYGPEQSCARRVVACDYEAEDLGVSVR